jgi:solute carrier family 35 protein E1
MLVCTSKVSFHFLGFLCALASTVIFVLQNVVSKNLFISHANAASGSSAGNGGTNTASASGGKNAHLHGEHHRKLDKLNVLFYSSTLAFIMMFPMWLFADGITLLDIWTTPIVTDANGMPTASTSIHLIPSGKHAGKPRISAGTWKILYLFLINGLTHFSQAVFAFWVLAQVSPITYSIASLLKRIFVIMAAIVYFGDELTLVQGGGILLTFFGLWMYDQAKSSVAHGEAELVALSERQAEKKGLPLSVKRGVE